MTRGGRAALIAWRLIPFVLAFLRDRRRWILLGKPRVRSAEAHERRAQRLSATIASLGPTFVKLAQLFSARADILPEPYLSAVGRLQDRVPPDPAESIEAVIKSELGRPADVVFQQFEREPVAAASLGQIHRARLDGELVAVKVLRPDVEEIIAVDLDISFRVLFFLNILFPNQHVRSLTNVVREFSVRIRDEMDFRREAQHMERFDTIFADDVRVRAPRVYQRFTRRRVLVMEWVQGDKIVDLAPRFATGELDFSRLMEDMGEIYIRMLVVSGFLHADPHPGNLLVEGNGTVVFLDWGMAVELSQANRDRTVRLALAIGRDDIDAMVNEMYALGMIEQDVSRAEIRDAAAEILTIIGEDDGLSGRRLQEIVQSILDTFYTFPIRLPRELVYFFRAAALLEGIGLRYDRDFNAVDVARRVVRRLRGELTRAAAREPAEFARGVVEEIRGMVRGTRDLVRRAEREELRLRFHPRDIYHGERFLLLQVRRILLSIFALSVALITSITFLAIGNVWLLAAGLLVALFMFLVVFVLPSHLLENPLHHARGLRPRDSPGRSAD